MNQNQYKVASSKQNLNEAKIIAIDPGNSDLLFAVYMQNHATYRSMILSNFNSPTSNITSDNVSKIITKHLSYHRLVFYRTIPELA